MEQTEPLSSPIHTREERNIATTQGISTNYSDMKDLNESTAYGQSGQAKELNQGGASHSASSPVPTPNRQVSNAGKEAETVVDQLPLDSQILALLSTFKTHMTKNLGYRLPMPFEEKVETELGESSFTKEMHMQRVKGSHKKARKAFISELNKLQ